jgi:signal transduction histidine kinase
MRIRTKLAFALAIPLIALLAMSLVVVNEAATDAEAAATRASTIDQQVELATASLGPGGVIDTIQNERNSEAIDVIGMSGATEGGSDPAENRRLNDQAIADFKQALAAKPQAVQDAYAPAVAELDRVNDARAQADGFAGARGLNEEATVVSAEVFDEYSAVIDALFDANTRVALAVDDASLRNGARIIDLATRTEEVHTRLTREVIFDVVLGGVDTPAEIAKTVELRTQIESLDGDLQASATGPYVGIVDTVLDDQQLIDFRAVLDRGMAGEQLDVAQLLGGEGTQGLAVITGLGAQAAEQLEADAAALQAEAEQQQADAEAKQRLVLVIAGAVVLAAAGIGLLASRSITKPLARLTREAEDMADKRLPDAVQTILESPLGEDVVMPELAQVPAGGGYEIAEVADALNTVQASAADLAVEQAVLRRNISDSFVNLGRRNQNLLSRQLDSITEMEREETDPEELKKLFTLDHLATRMRRNAESLLLLAGLEPHRQWSAPVALIDVLRGSLGEVEDYDRVAIKRLDEATISGTAAADLTHLVAELLENALNFSPPGRDVEIAGHAREGGYTLVIVDNGVGMDAEDLAQANVRLAGGESFTVAPSRYLGHYVVGIQAARLGVHVKLSETVGGGVTASIEIASVLATDEAPTEVRDLAGESFTPDRFARAEEIEAEATSPLTTEIPDSPAELDEPVAAVSTPVASAAPSAPTAPVETTASGYKKRVRGANVPRTEVLSARGDNQDITLDDEAPASTADSMRSMLSGLQAGTERAQAEVRGTDDTTEEDR